MKRWIVLAAIAGAAASLAQRRARARIAGLRRGAQAGQVGERYDGYLGFATPPSPAVQRQVSAINIRRRSLYASLATRRGVTPEVGGTCDRLRAADARAGGASLSAAGQRLAAPRARRTASRGRAIAADYLTGGLGSNDAAYSGFSRSIIAGRDRQRDFIRPFGIGSGNILIGNDRDVVEPAVLVGIAQEGP